VKLQAPTYYPMSLSSIKVYTYDRSGGTSITSPSFQMKTCWNTAKANSPAARTIIADTVVPKTDLWSGTYCGYICELQVQDSSNNWIYYASSGLSGASLGVDGSVSFTVAGYSPTGSAKTFRTNCSGTL